MYTDYNGKENIALEGKIQNDLKLYNQGSNEIWEVGEASSVVRFKLELRNEFPT